MSRRIIETEEAIDDVLEYADYIAAHSSFNASDRFFAAVKEG